MDDKNLVGVLGFNKYKIGADGKVYKITKKGLKEVSAKEDNHGFPRINLQVNDSTRSTTKRVHSLVYSSFKGKPQGELVFLDGNKSNCALDNLVSIPELVEFYKKNNSKQ